MLIRRFFGAAFSFSFSSAELALSASRSRLAEGVGSRDDTDDRRMCVGVTAGFPNALGGPTMDAREDDADGIRVGVVSFVLDVELVRETVGGGPMAPSMERFLTVEVVVAAAPFARTLRASVAFTVDGVSIALPFIATGVLVALLASDRTEDGLDPMTLGVPKMDDSRRWGGTFDDAAGVALVAPRTLMRRLSWKTPVSTTSISLQKGHVPARVPAASNPARCSSPGCPPCPGTAASGG